jgi:signal recognition particle receptor subunit beta
MAWHDEDSWLTAAFSPNLSTILITLAVALILPILVHSFLYRSAAASTSIPTFLLVGPSGSGKTAFTTLVRLTHHRQQHLNPANHAQTERNTFTQTHTSTQPLTVEALLPEPHVPASSHYRSPGDPAYERSRRFLLLDTPGHGKLRHYATTQLSDPKSIRGIIFVVDAAALAEESGLNEAASYLHDVLLMLQKRYTSATSSKGPQEIPVLVAANKMDLFTALPANLVKHQLEKAISEVRTGRAKALRDASGALSGGEDEVDEEKEWLGEGGEGAFEFSQMQEVGTNVVVLGANVVSGKEVGSVAGWWEWIGEFL